MEVGPISNLKQIASGTPLFYTRTPIETTLSMSGINSAKVNPGGGGPLFKKKIAKMSPPLTAFDPGYLQRKAAVPEQLFSLKNGKQLSYFTEGSVEDKAVVCLPSAGLGKCCFIPREPIPGVFLIAIDPMGHGNSSPIEKPTDFEESVTEVRELLDGLKVDKFYVLGWCLGAQRSVRLVIFTTQVFRKKKPRSLTRRGH